MSLLQDAPGGDLHIISLCQCREHEHLSAEDLVFIRLAISISENQTEMKTRMPNAYDIMVDLSIKLDGMYRKEMGEDEYEYGR
jgi:hypothetical protein